MLWQREWGRVPGTGPLRPLLLGELCGLLAGAAAQTTVAWWLAARGGAADLARYGAAMAVISLLAMPLMSPMGDRWPKARLIRLAQAGLLMDAVLLALLAAQDLYRLPLLCACGALSVLAQAVLLPAQASLLPDLVPADRLPEAIRWRRGAQAIGGLLGPALGGVALATGGVPEAALLNVALAALAALAAWRLGASTVPARRASTTGWFDELAAGLRAKWRVRLDRWWTLTGALMMVFLLPCTGLLLPLRLQSVHLSASWFGACGAALSLGLLAGVAGAADALIRRVGRVRAIGIAVLACGLAVGAVGLCERAPALVLLFAVVGLGMSVTQLVGQTHRTLAVPAAFRARMAAGHLTIAQLAAMLAPALAGALLLHWPVSVVYVMLAAGFLACGLLLLAVPDLGRFLRLGPEEVNDWYGRTYPEAFVASRR
jgi:MFS family permease